MTSLDSGASAPTDPAQTLQLSWLEHLVELRRRILICLVAVAVTTAVAGSATTTSWPSWPGPTATCRFAGCGGAEVAGEMGEMGDIGATVDSGNDRAGFSYGLHTASRGRAREGPCLESEQPHSDRTPSGAGADWAGLVSLPGPIRTLQTVGW
jgi:hypothetical protein